MECRDEPATVYSFAADDGAQCFGAIEGAGIDAEAKEEEAPEEEDGIAGERTLAIKESESVDW